MTQQKLNLQLLDHISVTLTIMQPLSQYDDIIMTTSFLTSDNTSDCEDKINTMLL